MSTTPPRALLAARLATHGVALTFDNHAEPIEVSWRWLRDHGEEPASLNPVTLQRCVDTFAIDPSTAAVGCNLSDGTLVVDWPDDTPTTCISADRLCATAGMPLLPAREAVIASGAGRQHHFWHAGSLPDDAALPYIAHDDVLANDRPLLEWLERIEAHGFGLLRDMPTTAAATEVLANRIGSPMTTVYGTMWPLSADLTEHSDTAYSTTFLEPHTDGTYFEDVPGLQLFACLERSGTGGASILVDGFAAAERIRAAAPGAFELLSTVAVPGQYLEPGVALAAQRPTIGVDTSGVVQYVSFNNYDRAPFHLRHRMDEWYDAYALFHDEIANPAHWLEVSLAPGDVLVFDNWRLLHGRQAYTGRRVFEGCYHSRATFDATLDRLRQHTV